MRPQKIQKWCGQDDAGSAYWLFMGDEEQTEI
jgi:hypothetical protein